MWHSTPSTKRRGEGGREGGIDEGSNARRTRVGGEREIEIEGDEKVKQNKR